MKRKMFNSESLDTALQLNSCDMEQIVGGSCVTGNTNGVITGFCLVGSFLNPVVAWGCAGYGAYQYFSC